MKKSVRNSGQLAQRSERQTHNLLVTGSNPVLPIVSGWVGVTCPSHPLIEIYEGIFLTRYKLCDILLLRKRNAKRYIKLFVR